MKGPVIIAFLAVSMVPLYAHAQQPDTAKLKADARNAVGMIGGNKGKTQTYCQIMDLGRQINQAVREKDQKKAKALSQKIGQSRKQLPEFIVLSNIIEQVDLNSTNGREIALIIQSLNQSCGEE
jgi:Spy/CpxP family protein refolding chaperone